MLSRSIKRTYSTQTSSPVVGIIGSGPAAFYTAHRLLRNDPNVKIDMFESRPVPFGLVRYGVAPDHPEVKHVEHKFSEIAESTQFRFLGNVNVGTDVSLRDLTKNYDCLVLAYGAAGDKKLGIPGEDLSGVYSAREVVGWYNSDPRNQNLELDLSQVEDAVVIGHGNVSLDVARILLSNPAQLSPTDINPLFLKSLERSNLKRLHIVGRRNIFSVSFTIKELRELFALSSAVFFAPSFNYSTKWMNETDASGLDRPRKRLLKLLVSEIQKAVSEKRVAPYSKDKKCWNLEFGLTPVEILGHKGNVENVRFQITDSIRTDAESKFTTIPAQLFIRSIGYKSMPLPGMKDVGIPFDDAKGIVKNVNGFVRPGIYTSGWVKHGPIGVIATTMMDAFATADTITKDWKSKKEFLKNSKLGWDGLKKNIKTPVIHWKDWKVIRNAEIERGLRHESLSEKFRSNEDMIKLIYPDKK